MSGEPSIPPGSRAILIGVPHYRDPGYRSYAAVGNSVEGMYRLLVESGLCGWRADQVQKIVDPVDAGRLLGRLRSLAEATTGVLLLYFVGHGVISAHTGELCLAIADTDPANPDATGLEYAKIKRMLHGSTPAATRIAILDCCYSSWGTGLGGDDLADHTDCRGAYTLTAADERAHTPTNADGNPRTAFTGELLDLLAFGVPTGPPGLTLGTIYPLLRQRLAAKGLPRPNQRSDDSAAAFVFARNVGQTAPGVRPAKPPQAQRPTSPGRYPPYRHIRHIWPTEPPPANPVVFELTPSQQASSVISTYLGLIFGAFMIAARFIPRLAVWAQAGTNQEFFDLETLYLGIFVIVGGMAGLVGTLRSKLVLTQQGVWLIGLKTRFFRWNEITAVRVRTYGLNGLMRHVWLVRGDKSTLARVPIDVWGMRDRLFDHKVRSIQEWHARLGSPDPWWLDRR